MTQCTQPNLVGLQGNAPWSSSAEAWQPYVDGHQSRPPDLCFPPCRRRRRARSLGLGNQRVPRSDKLDKSRAALSATARRWTSPRRTGAPHPRPATNGCRPATARRAARPTAPAGSSTNNRRNNNDAPPTIIGRPVRHATRGRERGRRSTSRRPCAAVDSVATPSPTTESMTPPPWRMAPSLHRRFPEPQTRAPTIRLRRSGLARAARGPAACAATRHHR